MGRTATSRLAQKKGDELQAFIAWLDTIDLTILKAKLCGDFWNGRLDGTETKRSFLISQRCGDLQPIS